MWCTDSTHFMKIFIDRFSGWWFSINPSEKMSSSIGMVTFPTEWENKKGAKAPTSSVCTLEFPCCSPLIGPLKRRRNSRVQLLLWASHIEESDAAHELASNETDFFRNRTLAILRHHGHRKEDVVVTLFEKPLGSKPSKNRRCFFQWLGILRCFSGGNEDDNIISP